MRRLKFRAHRDAHLAAADGMVSLKDSLKLVYPNDHKEKISPNSGERLLLLSADAHKDLGNTDIHKDMLRQGMDLSTTWERKIDYQGGNLNNSAWKYWFSMEWDTNGHTHIKNVNVSLYAKIGTSDNNAALVQHRWMRYPADLRASGLQANDLSAAADDYSINIRDRHTVIPSINSQAAQELWRFPGFRLKPDEKVDLWSVRPAINGYANKEVFLNWVQTYSFRNMEKGGF